MKLVFNLPELAQALDVNEDTARRLVRDGKIRKLPLRHIKVSAIELNRFLSEGER